MNTTIDKPLSEHNLPQPVQSVQYLCPRSNVAETKENYFLTIEMPGVEASGLKITVLNNEMTIVGHRTPVKYSGDLVYRESIIQDYRRVFDLAPRIDHGKIQARIEQGVLAVTLPKAAEAKPRSITISD